MAVIRRVQSRAEADALIGMAELLADAVAGGASVGFLAPLDPEVARRYWHDVYASLGPRLQLWVAERDGAVVGSVQLAPGMKQNGRHRAEIQKLLVLREWRGQGIGSRLLEAAEAHARADGRSLLILDTEAGSVAESVYRRLGWHEAGSIPDFAANTAGELRANRVFYKRI